ncbi:hypothetical protein [Streptomyces chartreusis]|uniref:hypothetical protein n=1 Tax=Streptomyces chartreusis TaxID=1969 RepID=UPI0038011BA6
MGRGAGPRTGPHCLSTAADGLRPASIRRAAHLTKKAPTSVAVHLGLIPFDGSCEDAGSVTIHHHSHDGIISSQTCESAPCIERRRKAAARRAQKHTSSFVADDGKTEYGVQICGACHVGGFTPIPDEYIKGHPVYACTVDECGYTVAHADLVHGLTDGQSLIVLEGRLYVAEPYTGPALPPF